MDRRKNDTERERQAKHRHKKLEFSSSPYSVSVRTESVAVFESPDSQIRSYLERDPPWG